MINTLSVTSDLLTAERDILSRVALGGPLKDVLRDIVLLVEKPAGGELLASVLLTTDDGKHLTQGAAPSLPCDYNDAIEGIAVGLGIGSCGTSAHTGSPVIVSDIATDPLWADFRKLALSHNLHSCWSMPIRAADGRVLGTFANYYREPRKPSERDLEVIGMVSRTAAIAIERSQNEKARDRAEEQRMLLLRELNHRVKNVFALADSMLAMTARTATSAEQLSSTVRGRLRALGRAHDLVQPTFSAEHVAYAPDVPLRQIIGDILAPYTDAATDRVAFVGTDDVRIRADHITSVALVLHELATNAAKYGSLSSEEGRLVVACTTGETMQIMWSERGGPVVRAPTSKGFGSTLIQRTITGMRGEICYTWSPDGLDITICLPINTISASPDRTSLS